MRSWYSVMQDARRRKSKNLAGWAEKLFFSIQNCQRGNRGYRRAAQIV